MTLCFDSVTTRRRGASRVVVFNPPHIRGERAPGAWREIERCHGRGEFIESVITNAPALVIYRMRGQSAPDIAVLHLFRRTCPELPLIILGGDGTPETLRMVQALRPCFHAVGEPGEDELAGVLSSALERQVQVA